MTEERHGTTAGTVAEFDFDGFQRQIIEEFRAHGGRVGGMFEGSTLALLTTVGARTGLRRTSPLGYLHIDGLPVVVASAMGAPTHPAWYHNILRNPVVTVETGTETYEAIAAVPDGEERDALFAAVVAQDPGYGDYQTRTTRVIPVVVLHRIAAVPDGADRVRGLGDFIVEAHDWLRAELVALRRRVDEVAAGTGGGAADGAAVELTRQLRAHCREFCGALEEHHTGEDRGAFPMLAQRFPALAPHLHRLGEEHVAVARLKREIADLVEGHVPGQGDPLRLREDLERLASELEAHFVHEERVIVAALNAMGPAPDLG